MLRLVGLFWAFAAHAAAIASVSISEVYAYNSQYPTYFNDGDTYFSTWCGNDGAANTGEIFTWTNDEYALNPPYSSPVTSPIANMALNHLSNTTVGPISKGGMQLEEYANNAATFGRESETDAKARSGQYGSQTPNAAGEQANPDYGNWKTGGLLCIHRGGAEYMFGIAARTIYPGKYKTTRPWFVSPQRQPEFNSQIITQTTTANPPISGWSGFSPTPPAEAFHFASPEFPSLNGATNPKGSFDGGFIQYGQGYSCTYNGFACVSMPDGSTTYVYALFPIEAYAYNSNNMGIARASIASLIAHIAAPIASDWSFYAGGDGSKNANWSRSMTAAAPIMTDEGGVGMTQAQYIPNAGGAGNNGLYITIHSYWPGANQAPPVLNTSITTMTWWQAPYPWGPWTKFQTMVWNPQSYYFPIIQAGSVTRYGASFNLLVAGNYLAGGCPHGSQCRYQMYEAHVTVTYR